MERELGGSFLAFCPALFHRLRDPPASCGAHVATTAAIPRRSDRTRGAPAPGRLNAVQGGNGGIEPRTLSLQFVNNTVQIH